MTYKSYLLCALALLAATALHAEYRTAVDVYLDMGVSAANDTRWELSSAVSTADDGTGNCGHRRDYIFTCGYYNDSDATGFGPRYVCSASNNSVGWPKNPGRDPFTLDVTGWYTFEHRFYDDGTGVLAVDLNIYDEAGVLMHTWTLSNPADIIGATVGGNRYGWFVVVGCTSVSGGFCSSLDPNFTLPFDRTRRCDAFGCAFEQDFETDTAGWFGEPVLLERVASGTDGVTSSSGSWHAVGSAVNRAVEDPPGSGNLYFLFTRWGGYSCDFAGGEVEIDVRPGTDSNHINTRAKQLVPVAILGNDTFNPCTQIDVDSVTLRDEFPPARNECLDVDGDGDDDLVVYYRARDLTKPTQAECEDPDATVDLTGNTFGGENFTGTDRVRWQGPDCNF